VGAGPQSSCTGEIAVKAVAARAAHVDSTTLRAALPACLSPPLLPTRCQPRVGLLYDHVMTMHMLRGAWATAQRIAAAA
jgi:hypothetical protein